MKEERIEGVTLRSQEYQEKSRIISVYTAHLGLIQMIIKKVSTPRLMSLSTPFTYAEFHYYKGRSNLFRLFEGSPIDEHLYLREKLNSLKAAGYITAALLHLLLPESSDPPLYALYKTYLKQIPSFENTTTLLTSFYLKLLNHEALLEWCTFSPTDRPLAEELAYARSFETLRTFSLTPSLETWTIKMSTIFTTKTQ